MVATALSNLALAFVGTAAGLVLAAVIATRSPLLHPQPPPPLPRADLAEDPSSRRCTAATSRRHLRDDHPRPPRTVAPSDRRARRGAAPAGRK